MEFVSHGTEYDHHEGVRGWNDLTAEEQNHLLLANVLPYYPDFAGFVMSADFSKTQAEGLQNIIMTSAIILERLGFIETAENIRPHELNKLIEFLAGTSVGRRLAEAHKYQENKLTPLDESVLELLSEEGALDDILGKGYENAQQVLASKIGSNVKTAPRPTFAEFTHLLASGRITYSVDRSLAMAMARSGFPTGLAAIGMSYASMGFILGTAPSLYFFGWLGALACIVGAVVTFKISKAFTIRSIRTAAASTKEWYDLFQTKRVIQISNIQRNS